MDLYDELIKLVFGAAAAVLVPLLSALIVQQLRRVGLVISAEQQAQLEHFARQAILATEEKASQRLKSGLPVTSSQKLETAVDAVIESVPKTTREEATQVIHAQLPGTGTGAAAGLGEAHPPAAL